MFNKNAFNRLADSIQFPQLNNVNQAAYNKARLDAVIESNRFRPYYLPIKHLLPAAAQNAPISESSDQEKFSVIYTAAITNGQDRNVQIYLNRTRNALISYGRENNLKLSLDALAGHNIATAGYPGEQAFYNPLLLQPQDYLTLEMYQETNPGAAEIVYTVFNGARVYPPDSAEARLSDDVKKQCELEITKRIVPIQGFDVVKVEFDANGRAEAETPSHDEPYLILGFRANFTDALCEVGFDSQRGFSRNPFPIWAIASEANNARTAFKMLPKPLFMESKEQLKFNLINTIDGNIYATDGNIEILRSSL